MRVALFHNEAAGDGTSVNEISALLERHGHHLVQVVDKEWSAEQMLEKHADLVVAAGGDGTVITAARVLAGRPVPLAILPLGTANHIAKSLCCDGPIETLIESWAHAAPQPLDLGTARGVWGERIFIESVGAGLIPAGIAAAKTHQASSADAATSKPADAVRIFRDVLARLEPRRWDITLDGLATTGEFLLVEVLNMPSIGPNLVLSEEASPHDGFFSVVVATERHRDVLDAYLVHRIEDGKRPLRLMPHRARRVEIVGWDDVHVDDQLLRARPSETVSMTIEPAALEFLPGPCLAP
ncbi:MAG: diacylglycerol/lipid kinase family protein [Gammaproteobacteria bacterium]